MEGGRGRYISHVPYHTCPEMNKTVMSGELKIINVVYIMQHLICNEGIWFWFAAVTSRPLMDTMLNNTFSKLFSNFYNVVVHNIY